MTQCILVQNINICGKFLPPCSGTKWKQKFLLNISIPLGESNRTRQQQTDWCLYRQQPASQQTDWCLRRSSQEHCVIVSQTKFVVRLKTESSFQFPCQKDAFGKRRLIINKEKGLRCFNKYGRIKYALFWNITQCTVLIPYRRFGTTNRSRNPRRKVLFIYFLNTEGKTEKLFRNFSNKLPLYAT
jgi:hypothetical protein